ncbi:SCA7, zinc-binding domain-containing protein [Mortierella sp. GBAus27b]|nr:SCA7, zinc-binding domain-containing protein [Mortierella sp. GBAus27b]
MKQKKDIELSETGILNSAKSLFGTESVNSLSGLISPQTLSLFREQDRWKKLPRDKLTSPGPSNNELLKPSASWTGIRSQLDAEDHCELSEKIAQAKTKTPTASRLEFKEMRTYGGLPMSDEVVIVTCTNCEKPMIPSAYKEHRAKCKASQAEAAEEASLDVRAEVPEKKSDVPKSKKRKESTNNDEPGTPSSTVEMSPPPTPEKKPMDKKQKTAKPPKVKPPGRVKGPLDLDKQCGVIMIQGGPPCARSLTCKSHSMSAKRAVEGRSRPYDVLLGLYQKKPMPIKDEKANRDAELPLAEKEDVNLDSDEEFNDLLDSVRSYEPQPLAVRPMTYVRRRNKCHRIRDLFMDALKGPCRPILPGGSAHDQSSMHL